MVGVIEIVVAEDGVVHEVIIFDGMIFNKKPYAFLHFFILRGIEGIGIPFISRCGDNHSLDSVLGGKFD